MTGLSFCRGGYARMGGATAASSGGYTVYRYRHWAFAGTGLAYGDQLGAASTLIGDEVDGCVLRFTDGLRHPTGEDRTPTNMEIIAIAATTLWDRETAVPGISDDATLTDLELVCEQVFGDHSPTTQGRLCHGHAVMGTFRTPVGGTVFSAGTTEWAFALKEPKVAQITRNVLLRLGGRA